MRWRPEMSAIVKPKVTRPVSVLGILMQHAPEPGTVDRQAFTGVFIQQRRSTSLHASLTTRGIAVCALKLFLYTLLGHELRSVLAMALNQPPRPHTREPRSLPRKLHSRPSSCRAMTIALFPFRKPFTEAGACLDEISMNKHDVILAIPTKQKRRSTGQCAKRPLDPQRPENGSRMTPAATSFRAPSEYHGSRRTG
jgi:hypothetical protein